MSAVVQSLQKHPALCVAAVRDRVLRRVINSAGTSGFIGRIDATAGGSVSVVSVLHVTDVLCTVASAGRSGGDALSGSSVSMSVSTEGSGMVMSGERGTTSGTDTSEDGSVNEVSVGSALSGF